MYVHYLSFKLQQMTIHDNQMTMSRTKISLGMNEDIHKKHI